MRTQIRQLVAGIGIVILFAVSPVGAATSLDQNQPTVNSAFGFDPLGTFDMGQLAQSFKPANGNVAGAGILMSKSVDSASVSITIELWDNLPSLGGVCLASGSASYNGGNPGSWIDVSWAPYPVTPEATYYLMFKTSNTPYYGIAGNVNVYARGALYIGGTAYPYDFAFRTYYQTNTPPVADTGGPYNVGATTFFGAEVQLDASESSDPDADDTLSYVWTVGEMTYTGVSPSVVFVIGQTAVSLTVTDSEGASSTVATTVTVSCELAEIDVKPGSEDNVINMGSNGVIPVAFLSSPAFDATTIEPKTVALRGEDYVVSGVVRMRGKKDAVPQASMTDVNGDGLVDLLVHIETDKLADHDITAQISLGAMTSAGEVVIGYDNVTVIHDE